MEPSWRKYFTLDASLGLCYPSELSNSCQACDEHLSSAAHSCSHVITWLIISLLCGELNQDSTVPPGSFTGCVGHTFVKKPSSSIACQQGKVCDWLPCVCRCVCWASCLVSVWELLCYQKSSFRPKSARMTHKYSLTFIWALGIWTRVFMLMWQAS